MAYSTHTLEPWNYTITNTTDNNNITFTAEPPASPFRPSLTDILRTYPDYRASLDLGLYGSGTQLALGTVTNLLTMAVMTRRTMITSTTCFYFALLAAADLLVLYMGCLRRLLFVRNDHLDVYLRGGEVPCRLMDFLNYFTYDLCSWLLVAMTVDRFIAIRFPLRAALVCTLRNASMVVAGVTSLCLAKNLHFVFTFTTTTTVQGFCRARGRYMHFFSKVWPWIDASFYSFLPFSLLIVFNCLIIHCHRGALRRTRALTAGGGGARLTGPTGFNQRLTAMLLLVTFTFMAMTAPRVVLFIVRDRIFAFITPQGHIDFDVLARYSLVSSVFSFLVWTNHSVNFFLYCLSGKRFRRQFLRMLMQWLPRRPPSQVFISATRGDHPHHHRRTRPPPPRRGSDSSVMSDDVAPAPARLPVETEDALSRINRWATVPSPGQVEPRNGHKWSQE